MLAVAEDLAAAIPPMVGWKGSLAPFDFRPQELSLAPDARRFELSTMSYSAAVGLLASIKLLTGIGLASIREHAGRLAAELVEQTAPLGWTPYRALADRCASGHIVSLRHPAAVVEEVQATLARAGGFHVEVSQQRHYFGSCRHRVSFRLAGCCATAVRRAARAGLVTGPDRAGAWSRRS